MERIPHCILHPLVRRILGIILGFYDTQKRFSNQRYPVESLLFARENDFRPIVNSSDGIRDESCKIFAYQRKTRVNEQLTLSREFLPELLAKAKTWIFLLKESLMREIIGEF